MSAKKLDHEAPRIALIEPEIEPQTEPTDAAAEPKWRQRRMAYQNKVHMGKDIHAKVHTLSGTIQAACLGISPFEMVLGLDAGEEIDQSGLGTVQVELVAPQGSTLPMEASVTSIDRAILDGKEAKQLKITVTRQPLGDLDVARQRGAPLLELREFQQPQATANSPLYFSEPMYFRIVGFAARGARLVTSRSASGLLPGLPLHLAFYLPNKGDFVIEAKILRAQTDETSDQLAVDVAFPTASLEVKQAIAEYVLASQTSHSHEDLVRWGFTVETMSKAVSLSSPASTDEWCRVLALRLLALQAIDKSLERNDPGEMLDRYDSFAKHLMCKVEDQVVGSVRLVFTGKDLGRSEYMTMVDLPHWLQQVDFVELSRACVDPDLGRVEVLEAMLGKCFHACLQSQKRYVLSHCSPDLWPLYRRLGFKKVGSTFAAFGREDWLLVFADVQAILSGAVGDQKTWNRLFQGPRDVLTDHRRRDSELKIHWRRLVNRLRRASARSKTMATNKGAAPATTEASAGPSGSSPHRRRKK